MALKVQPMIVDTPSLVVDQLRQNLNQLLADEAESFGDSSASPGAATLNTVTGKSAIAAASSSVVITNSLVTANSVVVAVVSQAAADGTLLRIERISVAAGTFTLFGNAAATAATTVRWAILGDGSTSARKVTYYKSFPSNYKKLPTR